MVKLLATESRDDRKKRAEDTSGGPAAVFTFIPGADQTKSALPGWADGYICDLARVDCVSGAIQKLVGNWRIIGWKAAPDGHAVAVLRYTEASPKLQQFYFDLTLLPLGGGTSRLLVQHIPQSC